MSPWLADRRPAVLPGLDLTETMGAGHADTAGNSTADNLGTFTSDGAEHDATSTPALDCQPGLSASFQTARAVERNSPPRGANCRLSTT